MTNSASEEDPAKFVLTKMSNVSYATDCKGQLMVPCLPNWLLRSPSLIPFYHSFWIGSKVFWYNVSSFTWYAYLSIAELNKIALLV